MKNPEGVASQRRQAAQIAKGMKARRGRGAPVRRSFLLANGEPKSPMSSLLSGTAAPRGGGGRGGRNRVGLYLTLLWVLSGRGLEGAEPHSSSRPWRLWAELLGLAEPAGAGTRVVRAAARELDKRGFIVHVPSENSHDSALLTLRREDGLRGAYEIPDPTQHGDTDLYLRVPEQFWTQGLLAKLSGPELAMYLIALDLYRTDQPENQLTFAKSYVREIYGLGDSSRRAGLAGLVEHDVLWIDTEARDAGGGQLGRLSPRNTYVVAPSWRPPEPRVLSAADVFGPVD